MAALGEALAHPDYLFGSEMMKCCPEFHRCSGDFRRAGDAMYGQLRLSAGEARGIAQTVQGES
eukprot:5161937-Prorocentrum_lima.AAC.1